jgi:hypothetical protein
MAILRDGIPSSVGTYIRIRSISDCIPRFDGLFTLAVSQTVSHVLLVYLLCQYFRLCPTFCWYIHFGSILVCIPRSVGILIMSVSQTVSHVFWYIH